jgi:8-oxo-dGTP pyrophosphatase MutT (NUDIX family)
MPLQTLSNFDLSLPRKRMASGVLFFDADGQVLLVDPIYKDFWEIPGGAVELNESPREAARREMLEELGLDRAPGRILGVDWVPPCPERSEGLVTVFDGGMLSPSEVAGIGVQVDELRAWEFVPLADIGQRLSPLLARRVTACADACRRGETVYLEDGRLA